MTSTDATESFNTEMTGYDAADSHSIFDWAELAPTLIVYGFSFILGVTGNCLIIFTTFRYGRMHSVTNVFLSSLASSDLLLIIFCIPVKVRKTRISSNNLNIARWFHLAAHLKIKHQSCLIKPKTPEHDCTMIV